MVKYGVEVKKEGNTVYVERTTRESTINVSVEEKGNRKEPEVETGINFLDHMIETISWRSCFNIKLKLGHEIKLKHVAAEDSGIVVGKAFEVLLRDKIKLGVNGCGSYSAVIDEASSIVSISVEGRPGLFFDSESSGLKKEKVEDMLSADLRNFLSGFALGMKATIHVDSKYGEDPHHAWESVFRALGESLRSVFGTNKYRKNTIVGVKGTIH